ncbi:MAG: hypothetical protein QM734_01720 [Cyclobacteriaceae bacterium]
MGATSHDDYKIYEYHSIDTAFLNLYKIKILAGRNFVHNDSTNYIIINKTLMKDLQLGSPEEAVGTNLAVDKKSHMIIGVVDDFFSNSLKESFVNIAMVVNPRSYRKASVKLAMKDGNGSLIDGVAQVEKIWKEIYPEYIFEYEFLDDNIGVFYQQERKYAQLFQLFSFIFLLIGCLGLFGLITFVVNRKGKEIAVRKVLGATVSGLLFMFSKEYINLIIISFCLAIPIAYYIVNDWLSNFVHHITLQWWLFATPGLIVLSVAIIVVCFKSMGAANRNPVESLRSE